MISIVLYIQASVGLKTDAPAGDDLNLAIAETRTMIGRRGESPFGSSIDWSKAPPIGYMRVFSRQQSFASLGGVKWRAVTRTASRIEYVTVEFDRSRVTMADVIGSSRILPSLPQRPLEGLFMKFPAVYDKDGHWTTGNFSPSRNLAVNYIRDGGAGLDDLLFPLDKHLSLVLTQRKPIYARDPDSKWQDYPIELDQLEVVGLVASKYYSVQEQHMCDDVGRPGTTFSMQDLKYVVEHE